jgi:hypothetical protein
MGKYFSSKQHNGRQFLGTVRKVRKIDQKDGHKDFFWEVMLYISKSAKRL